MTWDEWESLKTAAAERSSARMRLNGLPAEGVGGSAGGGPGDLRVDQKDLAAIGDQAFTLHNRLRKEARVAVPSSERAAGDLSGQGFALGGALRHVSNRWERQLKSLMDACAHISNHMEFSAKTHRDDDEFIRRGLSSIATLDQGFDESYARAGEKNPLHGAPKKDKGDN